MRIPTGTQVAYKEADITLNSTVAFSQSAGPVWECCGMGMGTRDGSTAGPDRQGPQLTRPALPTAEP